MDDLPRYRTDPAAFLGDTIAPALLAGVHAAVAAKAHFAAAVLLDEDLVPDGPRYAHATWHVPLRNAAPDDPASIVVLYRHRAGSGDDVRDRMVRHAESLTRALSRARRCGLPEHPPLFIPVLPEPGGGPAPLPPNDHPCAPLFADPSLAAELVREFVLRRAGVRNDGSAVLPGMPARDLDFARMQRVPHDWIDPAVRYADVLWAVPYLDGPDPDSGATHALVVVRCEETVRPDAGVRLDLEIAALGRAFDARGAYGHPAAPATVVPVVVYTGTVRWDAPGAVRVPATVQE